MAEKEVMLKKYVSEGRLKTLKGRRGSKGEVMSQCKWCGSNGWFLKLSANGLCKSCDPSVIATIKSHLRVINDCARVIEESENLKTRLSNCDILLEKARSLLNYENKDIPTIDPLPSHYIHEYTEMRNKIILDDIEQTVAKVLTKTKGATTPQSKHREVNRALLKIQESKQELPDKIFVDELEALEVRVKKMLEIQESKKGLFNEKIIEELESRVNTLFPLSQLNAYLEEARIAESKGNVNKALGKYQEALSFLRTDKIDDSIKAEKIEEIEKMISELSR
jgi:hypothetical protein